MKLLTRYLRLLAIFCAVALLGDALTQALLHLHDLHQINHIAGIWMTLAQALRQGVFYPPLEQDGFYAGTRYMPLFFVLIAGLVQLTGSFLVAAKLLSLLALMGLLAAVFAATRRLTRGNLTALVLASAVLVFPEARRALLSPHADALAIALAVASLTLLDRADRSWTLVAVALFLFTLSWSAKFSSIAAAAAACVVLFRERRRAGVGLAAAFAVSVVVCFALLQLGSNGRFLQNFRAVGSGGLSLDTLRSGPVRLLQALALSTRLSYTTPLLLLPATALVVQAALKRSLRLWDWYFLATLATTLFIFTSPGTDLNHLLELEVASILVLARLLVGHVFNLPDKRHVENVPHGWGIVSVALLLGLVLALRVWQAGPPADALTPRALNEALPADGLLLTEDATVAVLRGERPVVMDAFAYRLLVERGLVDPEALALRIRRREFVRLVLIRRMDIPEESLAPRFHFGPRVTAALLENYRFQEQVGAYYLYMPDKQY